MTATQPEATTARPLARTIKSTGAVDGVAASLAKAVRSALKPGPAKDALSGTWLGHPLHPPLTDVVIGTWLSASLLDLIGGRDRGAADRLVAAGVLGALPTAACGLSDWADAEPGGEAPRRVGIVHGAGNVAALALQIGSLAARWRGARGAGVALSLGASGLIGFTSYLGGHLSFGLGIGVDHTVFDPGPEDWTDALAADAVTTDATSVVVGETPVLVIRVGGSIRALHDRCSHRGCPLSGGTIDGETIQCPCHGSRFSLRDGHVERGPATAPQPAFEARELAGRIELRRLPEAG